MYNYLKFIIFSTTLLLLCVSVMAQVKKVAILEPLGSVEYNIKNIVYEEVSSIAKTYSDIKIIEKIEVNKMLAEKNFRFDLTTANSKICEICKAMEARYAFVITVETEGKKNFSIYCKVIDVFTSNVLRQNSTQTKNGQNDLASSTRQMIRDILDSMEMIFKQKDTESVVKKESESQQDKDLFADLLTVPKEDNSKTQIQKEKELAAAKAKEKEEAEAKAKKEKELAEAKAREKEQAEAQAKREREQAEAQAKKERELAEAKARERELAEAQAKREKEFAEAQAKREQELAEAQAKREKELAEAQAKREKELAEAQAKKEQELAEAQAKKEQELAEAQAKKEQELAEAQAKKEQELAEAQAKKEQELAEAQAKKDKELAEAQALKDKEIAETQARKEQELAQIQAQKEKEIAEAQAQKEKELAELKAQKEKELAEIQAQKEKELAETKEKEDKELAEAKANEKEIAALKAQKEKEIAEAKAQKEKEIAEAQKQKEKEIAEAQAQKEKEIAEAKAQKEKEIAEAQKQKDKEIAETQKQKEKELAEAKALKEKELAEAKAQKDKEIAEAIAQKDKEFAEALAQKEKELVEAQKQKEKELAEAQAQREKELAEVKAQKEREIAEEKSKKEKELAEAKEREEKLKSEEEKKMIQQKIKLFLDHLPDTINFSASGGYEMFGANYYETSWDISNQPTWCDIQHTKNSLVLICEKNSNSEVRKGDFYITAEGQSKNIWIKQNELISLSVSSEKIEFGSLGGKKEIYVTSNISSWEVSGNPSWCSAKKSANGISLNCAANETSNNRDFFLEINAGEKSERIYILQEKYIFLTLSDTIIEFPLKGGNKNITINTNAILWNTSNEISWCPMTKSENAITFYCKANPYIYERSEKLIFVADNEYKTILIKQKGISALEKGDWKQAVNRLIFSGSSTSENVIYKGERSEKGIRNGLGAYFFIADNESYWGNFINGESNGKGIYIIGKEGDFYFSGCPGCKFYVGNWSADMKNGLGKCYDKKGDLLYFGYYYNEKPIESFPQSYDDTYRFESIEFDNGDIYLGETFKGVKHGLGIFLGVKGDAWYGDWKDGKREGVGIEFKKDGTIKSGRWGNDKLIE